MLEREKVFDIFTIYLFIKISEIAIFLLPYFLVFYKTMAAKKMQLQRVCTYPGMTVWFSPPALQWSSWPGLLARALSCSRCMHSDTWRRQHQEQLKAYWVFFFYGIFYGVIEFFEVNPQEETHKWEDPSIKCNLFISDGPVSLTSLIIERSGCTVQPTEAPVHLSKVTSSAASCILICGWRNRLASGLSRRTSVLTWWVAVIKTQGCITLTQ